MKRTSYMAGPGQEPPAKRTQITSASFSSLPVDQSTASDGSPAHTPGYLGADASMSHSSQTDPPSHPLPTTSDQATNDPAHPPMTRVLTVSDLPALMEVLGNAAHYTNKLGTQLGLDLHLVQTLHQKALCDPVQHLTLVLDKRLRDTAHPLSLQELVDTISKPPVDDGDLAWRLEQSFKNKQPLAQIGNLPLSPEMARYVNYLDAVYKNMAVDPKGGPALSARYINLAVIKKETVSRAEADEFTRATLHGGIDEIMNKKEAIKLEDIFKPEENQTDVNFVLVEGAPGVGKSTLALELCRRHREIERMRTFSVVLQLALREKEVQEAKSVADLALIYHENPRIQQAVVDEITDSGGEGILLVLDGFDEVPARLRKSSFIAQVICGKQLPKAAILVTSRPSARTDLLSLRAPHKYIEVLGFTDEQICQHACSVFGSGSSTLDEFLKYLSANPAIKSMMYVPLNCAIVVDIYQDNRQAGKPIPQTMTQLYSEVTLTRVWRHLESMAEGDHSVQSLPEKLEDLHEEHPEIHGQLLDLAKLAFEGTLEQQVIFEKLPAGCSTLGLMTESQQRRKVTRYNFFHLTMQEFLSAYYISQLPSSDQKTLFDQYLGKAEEESSSETSVEEGDDEDEGDEDAEEEEYYSHMDMVWRFVAGLTGFRDIGWELLQSGTSDEDDNASPFLVQCLYEAQEKVNCDSLLGKSKVIYHHELVSALDCFAVGYCIAVTNCTWEVHLVSCGLGSELLEMLGHGLRSQRKVRGSIDGLILRNIPIGQEGMAHLKMFPFKVRQHFRHLEVSDYELTEAGVNSFCDAVPTMTSLKCLRISWMSTESGTAKKVFQSLGTIHLHTLIMDGIALSNDDLEPLPHLIEPSRGLKKLVLVMDTQPDPVELLKITLSPCSLEHLGLLFSRVDTCAISSLSPLIRNHNIKTLQFSVKRCCIHSSDIASLIHRNTALETLRIGYMHVPLHGWFDPVYIRNDPGQTSHPLSDAIKVNRSLKILILMAEMNDQQTREAIQDLLGALQNNQTLERLYLSVYDKELSSAKELHPRVMGVRELLLLEASMDHGMSY